MKNGDELRGHEGKEATEVREENFGRKETDTRIEIDLPSSLVLFPSNLLFTRWQGCFGSYT